MEMVSGRFTGKTAMITNASGSVGLAAAHLFHSEGANVVMNDARKELTTALTKKLGSRAMATCFDLSRAEAGIQLAQATIEKFGSIDVLIFNELPIEEKPVEDITPEDWDRITDQSLTAVLHALQGVYESFKNRMAGSVILVSSSAARYGCSGVVGYTSMMGGVLGLMKSICREWSRWGVTCSAVCLGPISEQDQGMSSKLKGQFAHTQVELANRNVTAEQVAKIILFLASEDGKPINGQAINIDYGLNTYDF